MVHPRLTSRGPSPTITTVGQTLFARRILLTQDNPLSALWARQGGEQVKPTASQKNKPMTVRREACAEGGIEGNINTGSTAYKKCSSTSSSRAPARIRRSLSPSRPVSFTSRDSFKALKVVEFRLSSNDARSQVLHLVPQFLHHGGQHRDEICVDDTLLRLFLCLLRLRLVRSG